VSDPVLFGRVVSVYFRDAFERHEAALAAAGANPENGLGAVLEAVGKISDAALRAQILADIDACYARPDRPRVAMVDSDRGITNFHVPSDVIIDASMPAMIREGGQMWNADGALEDVKCLIPDRSYAGVYQACVDDCKKHGAFDVATMGSVANVGLMARKAEEYGSHDKTFRAPFDGVVKTFFYSPEGVKTEVPVFEHEIKAGDLWRMCQTKEAAVRDWVKLAVTRARLSESPAVFWLDPAREHDAALTEKVRGYLASDHPEALAATLADGEKLVDIMPPVAAIEHAMSRARAGKDTVSVTATCSAITSPTCSRSSSWARPRRCSPSCPCSRAAGCSRRAPAAPRRSTCSSSQRRAICAGTRWASTWRWRFRSTTWHSRRATRRSRFWPRA